ncbi:PAAR domain-containing protein [Paraburkholderia sediminicola]|uniref:PAAR domain-containing protein n=1 Tax=Paraburkholderia sediminicola TaxID=458836 RepID=UPI0038BD3BA5
MTTFYSVVEGDPLDSGGNSRIIDGLANCTIRGDDGRDRRMAFLGHKAWCDRCKSAGEIVAAARCGVNLRMFDATIRRYQAVGNDKVMCGCPSAPRIIPVYGRSWMLIDESGSVSTAATEISSSMSSLASARVDEQVKAVARGAAMEGYPYFAETADGHTSYGRTDANGSLPRIETQGDDSYTVHWGDEALARRSGI